MTPTPKPASSATGRHAVDLAKPQDAAGPFVLNLCSSTTPMALSNPEQAELKRFSFFVSRRFEEGRERFRLHMGYFPTLAEAEEWLGAVRDIYPGAWAGEAPGKKLRERAVAAAAAQAQHAAGPPPHLDVPTVHAAAVSPPAPAPKVVPVAKPVSVPPAPVAKVAPAPSRPPVVAAVAPSAHVSVLKQQKQNAPVTKAIPAAVPPREVPIAAPAATPSAAIRAVAARPAPAALVASTRTSEPRAAVAAKATPIAQGAAKATSPTPVAANGHALPKAAPARVQGANGSAPSKLNTKAAIPNSNVREVLKALEETSSEPETTGETRMMPAPLLAGLDAEADSNDFTDTQVLKYLEARKADGTELAGVEVDTGAISLLKPDDTGTRRALKQAIVENAPVWFAVQLQWAVQPVELSKVPPLAIFSAYTLYTVEGSRDGRKWYGLRLGFFSDAISAKQVAYYVRSEFTSVAVVPVSPQERTRASDMDKKSEIAFPKKTRSGPVDEFKLIDSDDAPAIPVHTARQAQRPAAAPKAVGPAATRAAAPAANARRSPPKATVGRVRARENRTPQTLEETLEILGAGELEMDNGTGESLNESGVRHLRVEVQKNTPFSRLLERLSERVRKP
jgi:hypothetical protein